MNKNYIIIGVGLAVLGYAMFYDKNKKNVVKKEELKKEVPTETKQPLEDFLPKKFVQDVKSMSLDELKDTFNANAQILADNDISRQERQALNDMLDYMEQEINNKV